MNSLMLVNDKLPELCNKMRNILTDGGKNRSKMCRTKSSCMISGYKTMRTLSCITGL
jgi:hypothetical protein